MLGWIRRGGRNRTLLSAVVAVALCTASAGAGGFRVRLELVHGHLRECWFGIDPRGTDGFDRRLDEMAPPPGIETGYTAFISPDGRYFYYKDIRGPGKRVVWKFMARVFPGKPIRIRWDAKRLPSGYRFTLKNGAETLDMRRTSETVAPDTRILVIEVVEIRDDDKDASVSRGGPSDKQGKEKK